MGLCLSINKKKDKKDNSCTNTIVRIINDNYSFINQPYSEDWLRFRYG